MPKAPAESILQYLRTILGGRAWKGKPDQDLVCQFVSEGDQAAFAGLVERHGPMVLGICRRIVHDEHLAEDAFQFGHSMTFSCHSRRELATRQSNLFSNFPWPQKSSIPS